MGGKGNGAACARLADVERWCGVNTGKEFGEAVKALRKYRKKTLPGLAKEAGISKGLLSKIENGTGNPTIETVQKIANAIPAHFIFQPMKGGAA